MRLRATEEGYRLERASGEGINLTMDEALELVPIARQMQDQLASRSRGTGLYPVYSAAVRETNVGTDAHHTQVLLRLTGSDGLELSYALSLDGSRALRDALSRKIEVLETSQNRRTSQ